MAFEFRPNSTANALPAGPGRQPLSRPSVPGRHPIVGFLVSLRPDQWTKNLIVFAGLIFGQQLFTPGAWSLSLWTFGVFCAASSAMYLVNDVADRKVDRQHPVKVHRPIAAGHVSVGAAAIGAAALTGLSIAGAFAVSPRLGYVTVAFVALLGAYTVVLKHVVLLDVIAIALGFVLRAVGGAIAVDVPISQWLLICTTLLALFLALTKRRHELALLGESAATHRHALSEYTPELLDQLVTMVAAATVVAYALYTTEPATTLNFGTDRLTWTLPFPIYGIFRYLYHVHRHDGGGSPTEMLVRDRPLFACVALWALAVVLIIYFP